MSLLKIPLKPILDKFYSAKEHLHGNVTNDGKISGASNKNVVTDAYGNITTENKPTIPSASSTTPSADTTNGSVGSGTTWAKSDHTHPKSTIYASNDHNHDGTYLKTGTGTVTSTNIAEGTIVNNDISSDANIAFSKLNISKNDITGLGIPGTDTNTTYSAATQSANGLMSSSDKTKLDGIATGANKTTVDSSLSSTSTNPVQNKVINTALSGKAASSHEHTKSDITDFPTNATTSTDGLMSSTDKTKLNGIATGANKTTIANNLTTTTAGSALDATQGKALNTAIGTKTVTVEKQSTAESGYVATYVVKQNGTQVGEKINIPKDFLVKSASMKTCTTANSPLSGLAVNDPYLDFVVNSKDGSATDEHIYINVKDLVDTYTAGTGLTLTNGAFNVNYGTAAGTACQGNDSRLSNARTPTSHATTATTYGVGTTSNYGHNKLVENLTTNAGNGLALGAGQGKALKGMIDNITTGNVDLSETHSHTYDKIDTTNISGNIDYNDYKTKGQYFIWYADQQNNTNKPTTSGGLLVVETIPNGVAQYFYCYGANNNQVYYRTYYSPTPTWNNWIRIDGQDKANSSHTHTKSQITDFPTSMTPTAHTDSDGAYGKATTSVWGHTKLNSATNSTDETTAATPKAVKAAYDLANGKPSLGTTSTTAAKGDHNHDGTYLKSYTPPTASTSQAGIVQLSDSTSTTSSTVAATSTAVKAAYDKGNHSHPYISTTAGSVGASNLASNAVEEAKIKDGNVTNAKLADQSNIVTEYIVGTHGTTATNVWTGTSTKINSLSAGQVIFFKMTSAGTSSAATLNLTLANGTTTGAKNIRYNSATNLTTHFPQNTVLELVYDGTYWVCTAIQNTNNYDRVSSTSNIVNGESSEVAAYTLMWGKTDKKYYKIAENGVFNIRYPIVWLAGKVASGSATNNVYSLYSGVNLQNTISGKTVTTNQQVYVEGTAFSNGNFTVSSKVFVSEGSLTSGRYYVPIGQSYSTTNIRLNATNQQVYYYDGTNLKPVEDYKYQPAGSYAASSHTHNYLPTNANGTTTGTLTATKFINSSSNNTNILLGNGNTLAQSTFATSGHTHDYSSTYAAKTHTHGNITNDGKVTTTTSTVGNVMVTDGSNIVKVINKLPAANVTHQDISGKANKTNGASQITDNNSANYEAIEGEANETQQNLNSKINEHIAQLQQDTSNLVPIDHSSSGQNYGLGSASKYGHVKVDDAMSSSSTNPVQNKVVNTALSGKAPTSHTNTGSTATYGRATLSTWGHTKAGSVVTADTDVGYVGNDNGFYARADHVHKKSTLYAESSHTHTMSDITDWLNKVYPIGSIYMNATSNKNPSDSSLLGVGTWVQIGQGRMLLGAGTAPEDSTKTYTAGDTDGSKNAVVVSHHHNAQNDTQFISGNDGSIGRTSKRAFATENNGGIRYLYDTGTSITDSCCTTDQGVDGTDMNMPPYFVVYMWKRTA